MRRRCAHLHMGDPAMQCRLFNSLVLPILSFANKSWAVGPQLHEAAKMLHRHFLKQPLHVKNSTTTELVLIEVGSYPLQYDVWRQVLHLHDWALQLPDIRLVRLALVHEAEQEGERMLEHQQKGWRSFFSALLATRTPSQHSEC